jgi:hypothetical protein
VARICKKEKNSSNWTFFLFFLFPNFRSDKIGIFLLEEAHFTVKETCLFPKKRIEKNLPPKNNNHSLGIILH